ncbi:uncharacterized protein MONBRDRAFT_30051 [Monosiga brevicollis MX1]|uniref:Thiamine-triphosphatase n=1 Tax=Monosiga brevicollis TaxID=81824 RepID=A9VCV9_MONBE|nr:uncharacterized protein MONBRDRAFT_30051 [Monosiga brevicollis MX1]EDQ84661.1 predicted protein [Monosiga brevicollis MX1]|eukprot:XP_001750565.1 hypothetical protein [Monosiga brevicollis MX1]
MAAVLEVELKFRAAAQVLARVKALALHASQPRLFVDRYFDVPDEYTLSRSDHWLRQRWSLGESASWELKSPPSRLPTPTEGTASAVDCYEERTGLAALQKAARLLGVPAPEAPTAAPASVWPYGLLLTERTRFTLPPPQREATDGNSALPVTEFGVDIDRVWFCQDQQVAWSDSDLLELTQSAAPDYAVGEVEIMLPGDGGVVSEQALLASAEAKQLLRAFVAEQLEGDPDEGVPGKVLEYLRRYQPDHLRVLVSCGLIGQKLGADPTSA